MEKVAKEIRRNFPFSLEKKKVLQTKFRSAITTKSLFLGREGRRRRIRFRRNRGRFTKSEQREERRDRIGEGEKDERRRKILLKLLRNVGRVDDICLESYFRNSVQDLQYENPTKKS